VSSRPASATAREPRSLTVAEYLEVVVVAEFVSPGSRRTDHVAKRADYADAGIPHYRIFDLDEPLSLIACHLAGELGYVDGGSVTGVFATSEPSLFGSTWTLGQLRRHGHNVDHRAVAQHRHRQRHADRVTEKLALDALRVLDGVAAHVENQVTGA
jgi:Putative restriction endonuclease